MESITKVKPYHELRRPYKFSENVRKEAKKRSGKTGYLEVHHRYAISLARYHSIAPVLIRSIANAVALSHEEHLKIHSVPHNKEWWDEQLRITKDIYIGGLIFLLDYPEEMFEVAYDSVMGEQRMVDKH